MEYLHLSPERRMRVFTVGFTAVVALYAFMAFALEPIRGYAETDNIVVSAVVASTFSMTCADGVAAIGTLTAGTPASATESCTLATNNATGYTVAWQVTTGTGTAGSRSGTGHLNNGDGDRFRAIHLNDTDTPNQGGSGYTTTVIGTLVADGANDERWGGRVTTSITGASRILDFAADTDWTTKKFTNVATGSTVTVASRSVESASGGDTIPFEFVAKLGTAKFQPTGTYKATVVVTTATQ